MPFINRIIKINLQQFNSLKFAQNEFQVKITLFAQIFNILLQSKLCVALNIKILFKKHKLYYTRSRRKNPT